MPPAILYQLFNEWKLGLVCCDLWIIFQQMACTTSTLNLCSISLDRYWAITKPLRYGSIRTSKRMLLNVALVWIGASCFSLAPLLTLNHMYSNDNGKPICNVSQNIGYKSFELGTFLIALIAILFVYIKILRTVHKIVLSEQRSRIHLQPNKSSGFYEENTQNLTLNEYKASSTLSVVIVAFVLCWLPFLVLEIVRLFLDNTMILTIETLNFLFIWLAYTNSALNPIIYVTLNREFRKPIKEILCCRCSKLNSIMRTDFYNTQYGKPLSQQHRW